MFLGGVAGQPPRHLPRQGRRLHGLAPGSAKLTDERVRKLVRSDLDLTDSGRCCIGAEERCVEDHDGGLVSSVAEHRLPCHDAADPLKGEVLQRLDADDFAVHRADSSGHVLRNHDLHRLGRHAHLLPKRGEDRQQASEQTLNSVAEPLGTGRVRPELRRRE